MNLNVFGFGIPRPSFFDAHGDEPYIQAEHIEAAQRRDDFLADYDLEDETRIDSQRYRAGYTRGFEAFSRGQHQNPYCADTESAGFSGCKDGHEEAKRNAEEVMA